jgi:hypothetical protein
MKGLASFSFFFISKDPIMLNTGKSLSEPLILASTNPHYDKILFIDLPVLTRKLQAQNMLCTYIVFLFMYTTCSELVVLFKNW